METLYYNGKIVTGEKNIQVITDGAFIVDQGVITRVGNSSDFSVEQKEINSINLMGKWVLPGLINTHGHAGMSTLRGYADDMSLQNWLQEKIWPMEMKMDEETIKWSSALAMLEMAKSGTTTFLDMYHPFYMDVVGSLVEDFGMRATLMNGMIGLCSEEEQKGKLELAKRFIETWQDGADGRISTMLAPHSLYTCPPKFLEAIVDAANMLHVPIHTHMSETEKEVHDCIATYGKRPAFHLEEIGMFSVPTLIAHGVHLNKDELDILYYNDVAISHNPISNLKLGSGIADITSYMKRGIVVSLGTDSAASNNNLDMFEEMRTGSLLQKGLHQDPEVLPVEDAFKMATINGAKALRKSRIGTISTGKNADFITIEAKNKPHLQPEENMLSHIVNSLSGKDICDVYVSGNPIVKQGASVTMDEEKIIYEANRVFKKLCS
ncbi:N-ethylammeline chlorohydrolase [Lottiidibacillus patelloidae]|uniref:5-methylthioadenosine/S-adenosylhomocysteine deaminase n=1 Tax=Lottiidibacillus patelloidae TaxID=2670334 RepID=A0A263BUT6_9BACI|nr:amidohydrolase [Lottiidibacillus patelloidae]OZM57302.1 N-ethylammeline chlorohydrolase [Lottiidibacillus patelloidae]